MRFYAILPIIGYILCGCGSYVPELNEWPNEGTQADKRMIQQIIRSIDCELSYVVTKIIEDDLEKAGKRVSGRTYTDFLANWGAEVAINLTVIERSGVNPTIAAFPETNPFALLSVSGGFSASTEATRLEKINVFYTVRELFRPGDSRCVPGDGNKFGSPLVDSDLKLFPLLDGRIGAATLGFARVPDAKFTLTGSKNVLSHTISFKILTAGAVTPSLRLVRATLNPAGNLISAGRDRTHELVITFGPLDNAAGKRSLIPIAENAHQNSQLQTGIRALSFPFQ